MGQSVITGYRGQDTVTREAQNLFLGRTVKAGERMKCSQVNCTYGDMMRKFFGRQPFNLTQKLPSMTTIYYSDVKKILFFHFK